MNSSANLDLLCDDLLIIIFSYAGIDRESVALTCKRFYKLICDIEKNKKILKIKNFTSNYDSMISSQRQFKEAEIDSGQFTNFEQFWQLRSLFFSKGSTVTHLTWEAFRFTRIELISLLNFFPTLTSLKCISWKLQINFFDEPIEVLNVPLKELKVLRCDEATKNFFECYLPKNVLQKLSIDFDPHSILPQQSEIKELELSCEQPLNPEILNSNLTHLKLMMRKYKNENEESILLPLIKKLPNLIELDLLKCAGIFDRDDNAFVALCELKNLKVLKIQVDGLSCYTFRENFHKLSDLEGFEMEGDAQDYGFLVDILDQLSDIQLVMLSHLRIELEFLNIPLDRIERMGRNFPNLKSFNLTTGCSLPVDVYLRNFKSLEKLFINYHYTRNFTTICSDEDEKFPKIQHLRLEGFSFGSDDVFMNELKIQKLIEKIPNVGVLELDINLPLNMKLLFKLLSKMPKLRILNNLLMQQSGENYEKFDEESLKSLIEISEKLARFSIELKVKAVDMNVAIMKEKLMKAFKFSMKKSGVCVVINLVK